MRAVSSAGALSGGAGPGGRALAGSAGRSAGTEQRYATPHLLQTTVQCVLCCGFQDFGTWSALGGVNSFLSDSWSGSESQRAVMHKSCLKLIKAYFSSHHDVPDVFSPHCCHFTHLRGPRRPLSHNCQTACSDAGSVLWFSLLPGKHLQSTLS